MEERNQLPPVIGKRKLLIVEDNELNRELLKALLAYDYGFYEAEDGQQGLEVLQEHYEEISLVLLDIEMPVMDGYGFLRAAKADPILRNVPVVITTGNTLEETEEKCLALGAADFVTKPYRPNIVRSRIRSIIALRESTAAISAIEYDELTGVYTKQAFFHYAGLLLKQNPGKHYSLIVSDIDDFKRISERYGQEVADRVLQHGASFIKPAMEHGIPVGRFGVDQFVTLMEIGLENFDDDKVAGIIDSMKKSFPVPGLELRFGICPDVDHSLPVSVLCDRALVAVRSINHKFAKRVALYDEAFQKKIDLDQRLIMDMKTAYDEDQFQVYYQPKHDTATGKLVGAEALIRWQHPELGFMSPDEFIPLMEKTGFICYADFYAWKRTCRNLRKWTDEGIPLVPVSVNTSREDYEYPNYLDMVLRPVKQYGIDPSLLHIEVTESMFSKDLEKLTRLLQGCRDLGFHVELDDFGKGYSSLHILGTLPLDVMKLDMSFMQELHDPRKARIFSACISLAQSLGLYTVAEGVETAEQRTLLKGLRVDAIQGYYFSKPLPEEEFRAYLLKCAGMEEPLPSEGENDDAKSGMYVIDEDYRIVGCNGVIRQLFPQMKEGEKCHKCLMGLDEPCEICPVKNGVRGPQTYLDPLRGVYETVQVVDVPLPEGKKGHALVLFTLK